MSEGTYRFKDVKPKLYYYLACLSNKIVELESNHLKFCVESKLKV